MAIFNLRSRLKKEQEVRVVERTKREEGDGKKVRKVMSAIPKGNLHVFLPHFILIGSGTVSQLHILICSAKPSSWRQWA